MWETGATAAAHLQSLALTQLPAIVPISIYRLMQRTVSALVKEVAGSKRPKKIKMVWWFTCGVKC